MTNLKKARERFNSVMSSIGCEQMVLDENYCNEEGIPWDIKMMVKEAEYWLSCYYEVGNVRCDDRFTGKEEYKVWVSETGMLKRFIKRFKEEK